MRVLAAAALCLAAGCVSISVEDTHAPREETLAAFENVQVRACPAERTQENARSGSDTQSSGVTSADIALTPLARDPTRTLRMRRIIVAPGGVIAWHAHDSVQGMALIVSGEMTEFRNSCLDPILYRAGDVAIEDAQTAHGWRNESDARAIILTAHEVAR